MLHVWAKENKLFWDDHLFSTKSYGSSFTSANQFVLFDEIKQEELCIALSKAQIYFKANTQYYV